MNAIDLDCQVGTGMFLVLDKVWDEQTEPYRVTNQTGGYSCNHPIAEVYGIRSIIIPMELESHFTLDPYNGWCTKGSLKEESIGFIENLVPNFYVSKDKLKDSEEAWIYGYTGLYGPFLECILTWNNSD